MHGQLHCIASTRHQLIAAGKPGPSKEHTYKPLMGTVQTSHLALSRSMTIMPSRTSQLTITPLPSHLRKSTSLGALVTLPPLSTLLDLSLLSLHDVALLKASLYEHGVLVFRNQKGIPPSLLLEICKLFDPEALDMHSGGKESVKDAKNILADNKAVRLAEARMVSVIGQGDFRANELDGLAGGEGMRRTREGEEEQVRLRHVVCAFPPHFLNYNFVPFFTS